MKIWSVRCVYVSASTFEKLQAMGMESLAYVKPLERCPIKFSVSANCWLPPVEVVK